MRRSGWLSCVRLAERWTRPWAALNAAVLACALACGDGAMHGAALEPGEAQPGGAATHAQPLDARAFSRPAPALDEAARATFVLGESFFTQSWFPAPALLTERDGVGPTFNARACAGCHFRGGRGVPPDDDPTQLGLLLRLSVAGQDAHGAPLGDPAYGDQLQDRSVDDSIPVEGRFAIEHAVIEGRYADGARYALRAPAYRFEDLAFGPLAEGARVSPRLAPQVIGVGLLEAIPERRLLELADPEDEDGDGISGRVNRVWDLEQARLRVGRFGWKAEQPSVAQQTAVAFASDIGATNRMLPEPNCPPPQLACARAESGGEPEVEDYALDAVAAYARLLAVPARRAPGDPEVLRGKALFHAAGCAGCHVPSHRTAHGALAPLSEQTIWPYTDLLLHDMGEALSDERPVFAAEGREWRTPPLWGIGLLEVVHGGTERLMHDGRARGVAEAILWHGGEAEAAKESFLTMAEDERAALVRFVRSL